MKKKLIIVLLIALVLTVWFVKHNYTKPGLPQLPEIVVKAASVKTEALPVEVQAIGTLEARSVDISPEVAGHVQEVLFKDGAYVKENDILLKLDDDIYQTKYELAKAKLRFGKENHQRHKVLGEKGILTKQALEESEASLQEKLADARESKMLLKKMRLRAPFSGRLGKSTVDKGDYVTVGQHVVSITDIKHLRVEYHLPELYFSNLKLDAPVVIKTSAYPGKVFHGKVRFISPLVSKENRSVLVYAEVPNEEGLLAPGMFVNVTHSLGVQKNTLLIKAKALVPVLDGEEVYRVVDGKAYAQPVAIGKRIQDEVEIKSGLSSQDTVITDGQLKIKNGMPVKITT